MRTLLTIWQVRKVLLVLLALISTVAYMAFPPSGEVGFPFSKQVLTYENYVYYLMEHVSRVFMAMALLCYVNKFMFTLRLFLALEIVDTVDFILTWGTPWSNGPITFNTLKCVIFGVSVAYDFIKYKNVGSHQRN